MLRKVLFAVFGLFITMSAHAGQAINVEWVHKFVKQEHGLDIPYADNPKLVVNMEYVLKVVDMANAYFNGDGWTNYGESEYATREVADTVAGIYCIRNLIERYYFTATTTPDTTSFGFQISAAGAYHVDWGDGKRDHYYKAGTANKTISHTYDAAGSYNIRIGGYSCAYVNNYSPSAISFANNTKLAGISGSLGKIFPTLKDKTDPTKPWQPSFVTLFQNCSNLASEIPPELFSGIHGQPRGTMFHGVFLGCSKLSGTIPPDLFAKIKGKSLGGLFARLFEGCGSLTGNIPAGLFRGIESVSSGMCWRCFKYCVKLTGFDGVLFPNVVNGTPAAQMFAEAFFGCSGLNTSIPSKLFGYYTGDAANEMFASTFSGCSKLSGTIPPDLFGKIDGAPAERMFSETFRGCSNLTGLIPAALFRYITGNPKAYMFYATFIDCSSLDGIEANMFENIYGPAQTEMFSHTFQACANLSGPIPDGLFKRITGTAPVMFFRTFRNCPKLSGTIPPDLFAGISDEPSESMFYNTFAGCSSLSGTIPKGLFGQIKGAPKTNMFYGTFDGCSGLTGIEQGLFAGISGAPANGMFRSTFAGCGGLTGTIPENLFGNIHGAPAQDMFYSTFHACKGLVGEIPDKLFGDFENISPDVLPVSMFRETFSNCHGLTKIPENLFYRLKTQPAANMFLATFYNCFGLSGKIPNDLFRDIYGTPAQSMFAQTFYACSGLTGAIPDGLFGDISGAPAAGMFSQTFHGCAKLGTGITDADKPEYMLRGYAIPETLFGRITENSNAAGSMFASTFSGCVGLSGQIPPLLFGGINGLTNGTASWMFSHTFYNCSGLTGEIPFGLFGDMTGAPQERMFEATFQGCSGLTKIPEYLFGHISGPGALCAYRWVFAGCRNLEGAIPDYLFAGVYGAGTYTFSMVFRDCAKLTSIPEHLFGAVTGFSFEEAFYGCVGLTGPSAKVYVESEGAYKYLYEVWPDVNYGLVYYMDTKLEDYGAWE